MEISQRLGRRWLQQHDAMATGHHREWMRYQCPVKGGRERLLPLLGAALGALKDWLALRGTLLRGPDQGALWLGIHRNDRGQRLGVTQVQSLIRRLGKLTGLPGLHPHLFRHSLAVHLLRNGADIRLIQELLGHADLNTTKIYLRLVPGQLKEDYDEAMPALAADPYPNGAPVDA